MDTIIGFAGNNWKDVLLAVTSVVTIFSVVAKFTKNTWDDSLSGKLLRLLSLAPKPPVK